MEKGKISNWNAALMTTMHALGTGIFVLPAFSINWAKEDAWLSYILGMIPVMIMLFSIVKLGRMFPGQTIVQYSETILGKYFGKFIGLLISFYFFYVGSVIIFELASFMASAIMPETPVFVFITLTGLVIVYTINKGLEVITRLNLAFFPVIVFSLFFIFVLAAKDMNPNYLRPVLANGFKPVFIGSFAPYAWLGTTFVMGMIIPYTSQPNKIKMPYFCGVWIKAALYIITTISCLAIFGPFEAGRISLPIVDLVKLINVANFIQNIEVLLVLIWVGGVFAMNTGWFYFSVLGVAQSLKLKEYRTITLPMMVLYISIAMLNFENYPDFVDWAQFTWPFYALFFQTLLPVLLLIIALVRGLGTKQTNKEQRCGTL